MTKQSLYNEKAFHHKGTKFVKHQTSWFNSPQGWNNPNCAKRSHQNHKLYFNLRPVYYQEHKMLFHLYAQLTVILSNTAAANHVWPLSTGDVASLNWNVL